MENKRGKVEKGKNLKIEEKIKICICRILYAVAVVETERKKWRRKDSVV